VGCKALLDVASKRNVLDLFGFRTLIGQFSFVSFLAALFLKFYRTNVQKFVQLHAMACERVDV
jgi:hypothetical protein